MMNDQVKGLYINLLTRKSARYRIIKVNESKQRASLAKANTINKDGDTFQVGDDIYGTFKVYIIITEDSRRFMLCPNIKHFRVWG